MNRLGRTTAFVWAGAILLLGAFVAAATLQLERQRGQALDRAATVAAEASRAAESSLNRALLRVDSLLVSLPRLLTLLSPNEAADSPAFSEVIRQLNQQSFLTRDVRIHGIDGSFLVGARPSPRQHRPRLEPDFLQLIREEREGGLRFASPTRDHLTGEWTILIGRRIELPSRNVAIAVAELPLDALADLISAPSAGLPVLLTLRRPDGTVLATTPHRETMIGRPLAAIEPRGASGIARLDAGDVPGRRAIAAARQVSHRPLVLRAAIEEEDALSQWVSDADATVMQIAGIAALLLAAAGAVSLAIRRRQLADAEVLGARRSLQEAIDSMNDGFILFDRDRRLVTCNRRYLEIFPHLASVARPGASIVELAEAGARQALPDGTPDQIASWVEWRLSDEHADREIEQHVGGRVIHVVQWRTAAGGRAWTVRDVTERKRAEAALLAAKAEAESVGRIRSAFLVNMGRQLRAPLAAIRRAAETMRDVPNDSPRALREQVQADEILRHSRHLHALIEEVLDLARAEAAGYRPMPRRFALRPLVESCTSLACQQAGAGAVDLTVQADDAEVCSDEHALRQIVLTLLSDVIRAAPGSRVSVEARIARNGMIRLRIADSGIAGDTREREAGTPVNGARDTALATVASYLAALNGEVEVDSSLEGGTAIVVMLPQSQLEPVIAQTRLATTELRRSA